MPLLLCASVFLLPILFQANCTTSSPLITGGSKYAIIGIVVVASAVVLTVVIVIIFWKFGGKSGGKCQCRGEDDDDSPWDTPPRSQPTTVGNILF